MPVIIGFTFSLLAIVSRYSSRGIGASVQVFCHHYGGDDDDRPCGQPASFSQVRKSKRELMDERSLKQVIHWKQVLRRTSSVVNTSR